MTKDQVKTVLDRVLTWPPERQEQAVRLLAEIQQQELVPATLSDEQATEIEKGLAEPAPGFLTLHEARERFARCRA